MTVAFLGLGAMGAPMSRRLVEAESDIVGFDLAEPARAALAAAGGTVADSAATAVTGASHIILMLPDSRVVESVLADIDAALRPGAIVIDMSSSEPLRLMLKDMRIATGMAATLGLPAALGECAAELWARAADDLGTAADQTDIARWVGRLPEDG